QEETEETGILDIHLSTANDPKLRRHATTGPASSLAFPPASAIPLPTIIPYCVTCCRRAPMRVLIAVSILLALSAGPISSGEKPADALAKLQGSWTCVEWLKKGNKPPGRILLKIDKNRYEWSIRPNPGYGIGIHGDYSGTIKIDPAQKPAHLDLVGPRFSVS